MGSNLCLPLSPYSIFLTMHPAMFFRICRICLQNLQNLGTPYLFLSALWFSTCFFRFQNATKCILQIFYKISAAEWTACMFTCNGGVWQKLTYTLWSLIFFIKRIVGPYPKPNVHIPITEICSSITHANRYFIYLKLIIPGWTYDKMH